MLKFTKTIEDINQVHSLDPNKIVIDGEERPHELVYTERLVQLLEEHFPHASMELQLAAHCQHINRWAVNRSDFEMNKAGYYQWRKAEEKNQSDVTRKILESRGWNEQIVDAVIGLITKKNVKTNPEAQIIEDLACLTFIKYYLEEFAEKHNEEKLVDIVRKTMNKMSDSALAKAANLGLSDKVLAIISKASA